MNTNLAYQEYFQEELIDGKIVAMSPRPAFNHNQISSNIYRLFANHLKKRKCTAIADGMDLYLTEKDHFVPDGMIVCDKNKIKANGVHGAPDLVVEVLSPSTMKNDRTHKKDVYEQCGVREYWIVSPESKSIEQYLLEDGKFTLHEVYAIRPDYELEMMKEEERAALVTAFKCSLYDDLLIELDEVFADMI